MKLYERGMDMQLSQKRTNQLIAIIQLFLCGLMAVVAFKKEISLGYKVGKKLKRKHKKKRKGAAR